MLGVFLRFRAAVSQVVPLFLVDILLGLLLSRLPHLLKRFLAARRLRRKGTLQAASHDDLKRQSEKFKKQVLKVKDDVLVAIGYALANSICIIGDTGLIIIDTCESLEAAKECLAAFREFSDLPVKAIVYTHFHHDHIAGASAYLSAAAGGECPIFAHASTAERMLQFNLVMGPIAFVRAARQFGTRLLPPALENSGIGPSLRVGASSLVLPTHTFDTASLAVSIAGVELQLLHAPGETEDQVVVFMPKHRILFAADNFYEAFPNLYAIRGVPHRDVRQWIVSLDLMRGVNAEIMVPSHTLPVYGSEAVATCLTNYRDALAFVHDQTVRFALKGFHPDKIASMLRLPDSLSQLTYVKEFYGTVAWSSKAVFSGYLGWFSGESAELFPLSPEVRARHLVALAGGVDQCLNAANAAIFLHRQQEQQKEAANDNKNKNNNNNESVQWGLELATAVLSLKDLPSGPSHEACRRASTLRVEALTKLGIGQISANARNYYLTQALETCGELELKVPPEQRRHTIETAPLEALFHTLSYRVDPDNIPAQGPSSLKVCFPTREFLLQLRNSVLIVTQQQHEQEQEEVKQQPQEQKQIQQKQQQQPQEEPQENKQKPKEKAAAEKLKKPKTKAKSTSPTPATTTTATTTPEEQEVDGGKAPQTRTKKEEEEETNSNQTTTTTTTKVGGEVAADVEVRCSEAAWRQLLAQPATVASNLLSGDFTFTRGNLLLFRSFMGCLDKSV